MKTPFGKIATSMGVNSWQVENVINLLNEGATIPFIARYRKEKTGELSDIQIIEIDKQYKQFLAYNDRLESIVHSLSERDLLNDELKKKLEQAKNINELEDIYLPFRPKRKTRASIAKEKGLEGLARMIMSENVSNLSAAAEKFYMSSKEIENIEDAVAGARDIIAEWISENEFVRSNVREQFSKFAIISSKFAKADAEENAKYQSWGDWSEKAAKAPAHRILALFRGEKEGVLRLKILPDIDRSFEYFTRKMVRQNNEASSQKAIAIKDGLKRLVFPSMETELRKELKARADESSIKVFAENLKQLLLAPPLGQKNILAIDPGFRTGCKVVCIDSNGNLLTNATIFPHPPQNEAGKAMSKINGLVDAYKVEAIAIGNGTAGRETENLVKNIRFNKDITAVLVNESGASIYSASELGRKEFPDYDVTVRGAVSIGRRLQDPLSELVKIDPKSIGVGQYQHDVDQKLLGESLKTTVELCVNNVGVDLNLASAELLKYVSGLGPSIAQNIVDYRKENGDFKSRAELKKVKGLGNKAFEQSAGFLRIRNGANPLDASAVHPEAYHIVQKIANSCSLKPEELIANEKVLSKVKLNDFVDDKIGLPTLKDIIKELEKPGRDPRQAHKIFEFDPNLRSLEDVKTGMIVPGLVTNITDFGAFIDIGIKENGLLHKSQIADRYVSNPSELLFINQQLRLRVIEVDRIRKRIGLSLKLVKHL